MVSSPHHVSPRVRAKLAEAERRVLSPPCYDVAWECTFTTDEKQTIEAETSKAEAQGRGEVQGEPDPRWLGSNLIQWFMNVRGVSQCRATIELAHAVNVLTDPDRGWLLRETGESSEGAAIKTLCLPRWDTQNLVLYYGDEVVRHVRRPNAAKNIVRILAVFEEDGWPHRICDPLPEGANPVRLAAAVRSLNHGLARIRFGKDGTGEGVTWSER